MARASLSVYRIGEPAVLTLDNQPIGSNGEVENYSVPAGRHKVAIRNSRGLEAARSQELIDGQSALFVYDANGPVLRAMTNADRDLLHNRRVVEQVHRFPVEHKHMWLRGKCDGDLVISSYEVEYRPKLGPHAFRIPFSSLKLKTEGQRIGLFFAADNKELRILEVQDPEQARTIQGIWEKLQSLKR